MTDIEGRYRIVVVCLGNICRSPIAEAVLTQQLERAGLGSQVIVESAGTGDWHVGAQADHRARAALQRAHYYSNHTARQFRVEWFDQADLVLGMDYVNVTDLRTLAPEDESASRVRILRSFDPALMHLPEDDPQLEVPDPYYDGPSEFDAVLRMIEDAVPGVIDYLRLELTD